MKINEATLLYNFMDYLKTEQTKDIAYYLEESETRSKILSQLWDTPCTPVEVGARDLDRDCDWALESAWIDEKRSIAVHVSAGKIIQKAVTRRTYRRLRRRRTMSSTLDIMGLSSLAPDLSLGVK